MAKNPSSSNSAVSPGSVTPATPAPVTPGPLGSALGLVAQIVALLAGILMPNLTSLSRQKLVKPRRKAWHLVPQFIKLAIQDPSYAPKGQDPNALQQDWENLTQLLALSLAVSSARKSIGDTVLQREAALWDSVLTIYRLASAQGSKDPAVEALVSEMAAAMATGPKAQKKVVSAISPTPVKGKKAKSMLLANARAEAGIPEAPGTQVTAAPEPPAVHPAVPVTPPAPSASNGANGQAGGSGH